MRFIYLLLLVLFSCVDARADIISVSSIQAIDADGSGATFSTRFGSLSNLVNQTYRSFNNGTAATDGWAGNWGADQANDVLRITFDGDYDIDRFQLWNDANRQSGRNDGVRNFQVTYYDAGGVLLFTDAIRTGSNGNTVSQNFVYTTAEQTFLMGVRRADVEFISAWARDPIQITELQWQGEPTIVSVPEPPHLPVVMLALMAFAIWKVGHKGLALSLLFAIASVSNANADIITVFDQTLDPIDWTIGPLPGTLNNQTIEHLQVGGNSGTMPDDPFRRIRLPGLLPNGNRQGSQFVHLHNDATFDPAVYTLNGGSISLDFEFINSVWFAAEQGGVQHFAQSGVGGSGADGFRQWRAASVPLSSFTGLDLSPTGDPITFGFRYGSTTFRRPFGFFDNFEFEADVTPIAVPEPSHWKPLLLLTTLFLIRRRRTDV